MSDADRHRQYKEYRLHCVLMEKESKELYVIIDRKHNERTLLLSPLEYENKPNHKDYRTLKYQNWALKKRIWRHVKELRKHYILMNKKTMLVLYGTKV